MRFLLLITLIFVSTAVLALELVGETVPPYPNGVYSKHGACIGSNLKSGSICDFSVGLIQDKSGKYTHVALKKFKERHSNGKSPIWTVLDIMEYPKLENPYFFATAVCRVNGQDDPTILAAVEATETELYEHVKFAYRANLDVGKFEKINVEGVDCWNEGWGIWHLKSAGVDYF